MVTRNIAKHAAKSLISVMLCFVALASNIEVYHACPNNENTYTCTYAVTTVETA